MQVDNYLKKYQPIIYKTFTNSLEKKHLSHAYLLIGNPGTPLLDVAKHLAKTILCDEPSPLACNNCITCMRIDSDNYPDFVLLDGSKSNIKKEQIVNLEAQFEKKAFEAKGIMIYILHLVENMSVEAINSILKFLEEPDAEVYAFLTTNNENSVLPTIISRCQSLHLKQIDRKLVIKEAQEYNISKEDAELLSYFYNEPELIFDVLQDEDRKEFYMTAKEALEGLLNALNSNDLKEAIYYTQTKIAPMVKTKEITRFFFDMLIQVFEDILNIQNSKDIILESYATILTDLSNKLHHISDTLVEILKQRNLVNLNLNTALQIDHLIYEIVKE